jgi:hypothetical protein
VVVTRSDPAASLLPGSVPALMFLIVTGTAGLRHSVMEL